MKLQVRNTVDRLFTGAAYGSILFLAIALVSILGPMLWKGSRAVFFRGTVEFRRMQLELFEHGNPESVAEEAAKANEARDFVFKKIIAFREGMDPELLTDQVKEIYREFGQRLRYEGIDNERYSELRREARRMREYLEDAFYSNDIEEIQNHIEDVLAYEDDTRFSGTIIADYFPIARNYLSSARSIDLQKRDKLKAEFNNFETLIRELLGPLPGEELPHLDQNKYGATRWDKASEILHRIHYKTKWVEKEEGQSLVQVEVSRAQFFSGTALEEVFPYIEKNAQAMLIPDFTIYWRYFFDDNKASYYFGGIGPEILGTLLITLIGMLFTIPFGIIAAAYLVECAGDNWIVRILRMCINTLAGVPSIVFGLFGLAFFVLVCMPAVVAGLEHLYSIDWLRNSVLWLHDLPAVGGFFQFVLPVEVKGGPCVLAASLTLAVLTLPVIIRASEEAIRSVPQTYREASLGLGASRFTTFMKVTLPAAMPGIFTGIILSLSRVAGETAPILFTGAIALGPLPENLLEQTRTLSYGSYHLAVGDRIAKEVPHKQFGMVVTLIILVLLMNMISIILRSRMAKKLRGA